MLNVKHVSGALQSASVLQLEPAVLTGGGPVDVVVEVGSVVEETRSVVTETGFVVEETASVVEETELVEVAVGEALQM